MKFTNKAELIEQAIKDGACDKGIKFAKSCKDLQEIFDTIDKNMLWWCIRKGYEQFADRCNLKRLDGWYWSRLLSFQPQFSSRCDWGKLDGWDWSILLSIQPQFSSSCDWGKLNGLDWSILLSIQPQFSDRCDWEKLDGLDWYRLLSNQPQLASYRK